LAHLHELIEQARFTDARIGDRGDNLAVSVASEIERASQLSDLWLAADELGKAALRRDLKPGLERANAENFVNFDLLADAFAPGSAQGSQLKVTGDQALGRLRKQNRAGRRERLHPRREAGRMTDRRVFALLFPGTDGAHHHLAGVQSD